MGPPSRARARRHRVLVVWLGVLLLTQRSICTTAASRRVNPTNNTNTINTTPTPNESHVTSEASIPTSIDTHLTSTNPNDSHVKSEATDPTSNVSDETSNTPQDARRLLNQRDLNMLSALWDIDRYVVPVLASVGVAANAISIAVWSGERAFNPATFFIKALSVADMVLIGARLMRIVAYYQYGFAVQVFTTALYNCGMNSSVHLTLALVVSRWLSVHRPLRVHRLLTKRRTVASMALLLLWCGALATLSMLPYFGVLDTYTNANFAIWLTTRVVSVVLPVMMLMFFSASLVRFMCRRSHHAGGISPSPSRRQREARATQLRRGVAAVVCVSVTTLLTYPVVMLVEGLVDRHREGVSELCGIYCGYLISSVVDLLEVFNSAVTPLYYVLFASRFRQLFWSRCKSCQTACRNPPCVPAVRRARDGPQPNTLRDSPPCVPAERRARHGPQPNKLQESSPCVLVEMQSLPTCYTTA